MPPRLTPRAMFWTGLGLAGLGMLLQLVALEAFAHTLYSSPVQGTVAQWAVSTIGHVVQVLVVGGAALTAGSFVVRALRPDDPPRVPPTPDVEGDNSWR